MLHKYLLIINFSYCLMIKMHDNVLIKITKDFIQL